MLLTSSTNSFCHPVSDRRLIYSLICLTSGNIIITVVMMCQCHLYFSSFTARRPLSLTPTSFCFSPTSPNTLCSEGRTWCLGTRGIWARDHRDYSTVLLGALSPSGNHSRDYGDSGENRGIFYFVETDVAFLESNGNSNKLAFFVSS